MNFFIPIIPTAQARGRAGINRASGHAMIYPHKKQYRNQDDLIALMSQYAPKNPMEGPLKLCLDIWLPVPASWSKKKRAAAINNDIWPAKRPDLDNYLKQVMDCMTKLGFWKDDSQVCITSARKCYWETPGWNISLEII
jgi:Holliday junction resolvase RusA-like endonuclease